MAADEASADSRPRPRGRPRRIPLDEQRQQILAAARTTFADYGFHGATIERVARTAGVVRPTVYEQFGGKEELFIAVADDITARLIEGMRARLEEEGDAGPRSLIRSRVAGLFELLAEYPEAAALWDILRRGVVGAAQDRATEALRNLEEAVAGTYQRDWVPEGEISAEAARVLALLTITAVESVGVRQPTEARWDAEATIDLVTDFLLGGLLRLATRPGGIAHWGDPTS